MRTFKLNILDQMSRFLDVVFLLFLIIDFKLVLVIALGL
jgi:hypothetical protein